MSNVSYLCFRSLNSVHCHSDSKTLSCISLFGSDSKSTGCILLLVYHTGYLYYRHFEVVQELLSCLLYGLESLQDYFGLCSYGLRLFIIHYEVCLGYRTLLIVRYHFLNLLLKYLTLLWS